MGERHGAKLLHVRDLVRLRQSSVFVQGELAPPCTIGTYIATVIPFRITREPADRFLMVLSSSSIQTTMESHSDLARLERK